MDLRLETCYLNIEFKVENKDVSNLAADVKASLVSYAIVSSFRQVDVFLNGKLISNSRNAHAYRSMLEVLLGYDQGAKNSYLTMDSKSNTQRRKWIW